jgi:hypothetical protein
MYRYTAARQRMLVSQEAYQPPQRFGGGSTSTIGLPPRTLVLIFIANSCC